jgi:hypothetical protein
MVARTPVAQAVRGQDETVPSVAPGAITGHWAAIWEVVPGQRTFWSAGAAAAAISRRWERRAKSRLSATIPIVNHQL